MDKDTEFLEKDNQSETIVSETTETIRDHEKKEKMPIESTDNIEIEKEVNNGENDDSTKTAENTDKKRKSNENDSPESKKLEDDKNINLKEKKKNEEEEKVEKENEQNEEKKEKEVSEFKIKGYEDIFKKIINKKTEKINKIARKKFRFWKDKLNKLIVTKTILVRISVSRDKDNKDRSYSDTKSNGYKRNFKKISNKILISNKKDSDTRKTNYKPFYRLRSTENNSTDNSSSTKKYKFNIKSNLDSIKQNINNFRSNNKLLNSAHKQKTIDRKKIIEISNKKPEEKRNYIKVNINKKLISTNRNNKKIQKINNSISKVDSNYKFIKDVPLGEKYIDFHKNENYNTSTEKLFYKKYEIKYANKSALVSPSFKLKNKAKPMLTNLISSYNTKKYIPPKNIFSGKKIVNNFVNLRNAFRNNNDKSLSLSRSHNLDNKNMIFKSYSSRKDNKIKKRFLDKDPLRRGVTTVFQHYCGICEEFENYIPTINYSSMKL